MKKITTLLVGLLMLCSLLAGCGGSKDSDSKGSKGSDSGSISLAKIKQAAKDAGYVVTDDYVSFGLDEVTGGFSVEIVADNEDVIYSVLECKNEDAAKKNAKTIDDAGYNIAIRNGKILSCYGVDRKNGTGRTILESILKGTPTAAK